MDVRRPDLGEEISLDPVIIAYLADKSIAVEFYEALCNVAWKKRIDIPEDQMIINKLIGISNEVWTISWRRAAELISDIRDINYDVNEDYMDFYCSGNEGRISTRVEECFKRMEWTAVLEYYNE